jgi:superfamily II DNA or RNA helicase
MKIYLRDYQSRNMVQIPHHLKNGGDALIEYPTGSGKTSPMIVGITASILNNPFHHIVIAAPQQQIEENFLSKKSRILEFPTDVGVMSSTIKVEPELIIQLRDNGRDGVVSNLKRYLNNTIDYAIVCTHQSLTYEKPENILPLSLTGYLLILDEAHHQSADALAKFIELWKARGGQLLYATATPFRKDGRPVLREGMKLFRRLIAQHMEEGFAPAELNNEIIGVSVPDAVSALEFTGDEITETHLALVIDATYEAWVRDGKPKAIIRAPSGNSQKFISYLMQKFAGARILNGAGTDSKDKERFIKGLTDPSEKTYVTSKYDLVVGVQRVLEGTDWSVCSHVYCVGVPGSLTTVVQLIGRALRKKDDTHPVKDKAKVSFFVLGANEKSLKNLEIKHSRHALLTCVFMADYHLGSEWIINKQITKGIKSGLKNGEITPSLAGELETELNNDPVSPEDRANISLLIIDAITSAEESGKETPTVAEIVELIKSNNEFNFDDDTINQIITENLASRNDKTGEQVRDNFGSLNFKPGIDKEKKKIFAKVVKEFRNETLDSSLITIGIKNQLHKITGGNIKEFCDRLIKIAYLSYDEASNIVAQENINSQADWVEYCKNGRKPDNIPYHPDRAYKDCGWVNLSVFLQSDQMRSHGQQKSYDEFVQYIRKAVERGELEPTHVSYQKWSASDKRPNYIPGSPEKFYKNNGFTSWVNVFDAKPYGKQKAFMSFDDAKTFVQKLSLKSQKEWLEWKRAGNRPEDLPCDPQTTYKKQWISWGDFLGTNTISSRDLASKFPSFEEAKAIISGKFSGKEDYQKNKPENLPYQPNRTYKDKWIGWKDFLNPPTKQKHIAKCSINGCDRLSESNGLCGAHYRRSRFGLDMNQPIQSRHAQSAVCEMKDCDKVPIAKNLCRTHYNQMWKKHDL